MYPRLSRLLKFANQQSATRIATVKFSLSLGGELVSRELLFKLGFCLPVVLICAISKPRDLSPLMLPQKSLGEGPPAKESRNPEDFENAQSLGTPMRP